ncbi:MAG: YjbQ family protein, partial [Candidatus Desulfovibrio faecigallinarum]|nr:YjbQ family protein [Candidatus Desulfovibrio faecigallinarum]
MEKISISTSKQSQLVNITEELGSFLARNADKNWTNGFICVFCPHTTCGVTINEGYDPDVRKDISDFL